MERAMSCHRTASARATDRIVDFAAERGSRFGSSPKSSTATWRNALIREVAAREGIALTPYEKVTHRSFAAVAWVNSQIVEMQRTPIHAQHGPVRAWPRCIWHAVHRIASGFIDGSMITRACARFVLLCTRLNGGIDGPANDARVTLFGHP
jgi:hypothetical protein